MTDASPARPPRPLSPLLPFAGERPPAPAWATAALAQVPERSRVEVDGAGIELLAWGERGRPGLLFLHGGGAHAGWWSPLAPLFAAADAQGGARRCAAISFSGMGGSGWRARYDFDRFRAEAMEGARAAGLFEAQEPPVVVAHSFGGAVAAHLAAGPDGARWRGAVIVDAGVRPPERRGGYGPPRRAEGAVNRVMADTPEALARFRLMADAGDPEPWYLDHVARGSLAPAGEGWTWAFDPLLWTHMDRGARLPQEAELAAVRCPLAFVSGERSSLMTAEAVAYTALHAPPGTPMIAAPGAAHHVMLDQPLVFVAILRTLLATWALTPP